MYENFKKKVENYRVTKRIYDNVFDNILTIAQFIYIL